MLGLDGHVLEEDKPLTMNAYSAFSTGQGRLLVSEYRSVSVNDEVDVSVRLISVMALWTSMMHMAVSSRNIMRTIIKIGRAILDLRFLLLRLFR